MQALLSMRKSLDRDKRYIARHGEIYLLRLPLPRQPDDPPGWPVTSGKVVMVSSPEILREIFTTAAPSLAGGEGRRFTEWVLGRQSLMVLDGAEHIEERRALLSLFTPERLARAETVMREQADRFLSRLPESGQLQLATLLDEIVPEISSRLMFGAVDLDLVARLRDGALRGFNSVAWSVPVLIFPWLRRDLGPLSPGGKAARILAEFRAIVARQAGLVQSGATPEECWLSGLLALEKGSETPDTIERRVSRVLTLFGAADVPAAALMWCFYHLLRNPDVLARAQEEARAEGPGPVDARPYLEAICKESLRIHTPVAVLTRRVTAPVSLGGYRLEPGTYVVGSIIMAHRRPESFPEPECFRPERFLERSYSPFEYLPFGGGARRCLGQAIGFRQMAIVLAALLRSFDLRPEGSYRFGVTRRAIIFLPKTPLPVRFRRVAPLATRVPPE